MAFEATLIRFESFQKIDSNDNSENKTVSVLIECFLRLSLKFLMKTEDKVESYESVS